eukprot:scaffold10046_cov69-Phaeocystis_antarctica.AAC.2
MAVRGGPFSRICHSPLLPPPPFSGRYTDYGLETQVRLTPPRPTDTDTVSGARVLRVLSDDSFSHNSPKPHPAGRPRRGGRASAVLAPHPPSSKKAGSR